MMKKIFGLIFVAALITSCSSVKNAAVDYAHDFDFTSVKTFQYWETEESNIKNPLLATRIARLIKEELREGGLTEVDENPDIVVTYHVTTEDNTSYNTTSMGYGGYPGYGGWGPGWGGYGRHGYGYGGVGMSSSTTYATTYTEGTLILDAFDPATKKVVWRGLGTVTVKDKSEQQTEQIEKILAAIGAKWDKILKGKGK
jgi:hypothetical protein